MPGQCFSFLLQWSLTCRVIKCSSLKLQQMSDLPFQFHSEVTKLNHAIVGWREEADPARRYVSALVNIRMKLLHFWN